MNMHLTINNFFKLAEDQYLELFANKLGNLINKDISIENVQKWLEYNNIQNFKNLFWAHINFKYNLLINSKENIHMIISLNKINLPLIMNAIKFNPGVTVKEEKLLNKKENIPNLYLYIFELENKRIEDLNKKNDYRFKYLIDFIESYGLSLYTTETQLNDSINYNKQNIENMEKLFNYAPKELGRGDSGIAYDIGKNKVLKLFKDLHIYNKALEAMERLHKQPKLADTEAMIYDAGYLGKFVDIYVYYYIMEKLEPANQDLDIDQLITDIIFYMQEQINFSKSKYFSYLKLRFNEIIKSNDTFDDIIAEINNISVLISIKLKNDKKFNNIEIITEKYNLNNNWLNLFIKEIIMKYLTGRTDLHIGNLGITKNRKLRYFDPAHPDLTNIIKAV